MTRRVLILALILTAGHATAQSLAKEISKVVVQQLGLSRGDFQPLPVPVTGVTPGDIRNVTFATRGTLGIGRHPRRPWYFDTTVLSIDGWLEPLGPEKALAARKSVLVEQRGGAYTGASNQQSGFRVSLGDIGRLIGVQLGTDSRKVVAIQFGWNAVTLRSLQLAKLSGTDTEVSEAGEGVREMPFFQGGGSYWLIQDVIEVTGLVLTVRKSVVEGTQLSATLPTLVDRLAHPVPPVEDQNMPGVQKSLDLGVGVTRDALGDYRIEIADSAVVAGRAVEYNKTELRRLFGGK
jgi:hypothetical protein